MEEKNKKHCVMFAGSYCCVLASRDSLEVPSSYLKAKCKCHSTDTRLPSQMVPTYSANPSSGVHLNAVFHPTFAFSPDMGTLNRTDFEGGCCQDCGEGEEYPLSCIYIPGKGFWRCLHSLGFSGQLWNVNKRRFRYYQSRDFTAVEVLLLPE